MAAFYVLHSSQMLSKSHRKKVRSLSSTDARHAMHYDQLNETLIKADIESHVQDVLSFFIVHSHLKRDAHLKSD